jgi:hypothetical protein
LLSIRLTPIPSSRGRHFSPPGDSEVEHFGVATFGNNCVRRRDVAQALVRLALEGGQVDEGLNAEPGCAARR